MRIDLKNGKAKPYNPVLEGIRRQIANLKGATVDDVAKIVSDRTKAYNRTPQAELGGLSPEQAHALTKPGWMDEAVVLNEELSLEELENAPLFQNARRTLLAIDDLESVKATAKGSFNRHFASRMFEEFSLTKEQREDTLRYNKIINQDDVPMLLLVRHLLHITELVRLEKGAFRLDRLTGSLLADESEGVLYALLFRALFLRINLDAFDGLPEAPQVQKTIGFSIYQLSKITEDWVNIEDIAESLFFAELIKTLPVREYSRAPAISYAEMRVLRPFNKFGLIEITTKNSWMEIAQIRKTPLFDRFIKFNLPPAFKSV